MHGGAGGEFPQQAYVQGQTENQNYCKQRNVAARRIRMCIQQHMGADAVWDRDQRPAEKWSGQGRTSRTGDAASVMQSALKLQTTNLFKLPKLLVNTTIWLQSVENHEKY